MEDGLEFETEPGEVVLRWWNALAGIASILLL
jgi:hypothetical protein